MLLLLRLASSDRVLQEDLASFDTTRVETCRVCRAGHGVFDIGGRERGDAAELDALVLRGQTVGYYLATADERLTLIGGRSV